MKQLLHRSDNFIKVHNKCSKNPHCKLQCALQLACTITCLSSELIFTCLYADSNIQNANAHFVWCIHLSCVNFYFHLILQTKI